MYIRRNVVVSLSVVLLLSASIGRVASDRTTSCTGPPADGDNENCRLVLYGGEKYEIEAMYPAYTPWKGTGVAQEFCPGDQPLEKTLVTGQCALADLKTPADVYGATVDQGANSTAQGVGLVWVMPATVQANGVAAYTVNFKHDGQGNPTHRFVTQLISSTESAPSAAFAPAFVGVTMLFSAAVVALVALF